MSIFSYFQLDDEEESEAYKGPVREINLESFKGQEMEIDQKLPTQDQRVPAANGVADDGEYHIFVDGTCAIIKGAWVPTIKKWVLQCL